MTDMPDMKVQQASIREMAERIARAFLDAYHERPGSFDELPPDDDMGLTPRRNSMRGALAVMGELEMWEDKPQAGDIHGDSASGGLVCLVRPAPQGGWYVVLMSGPKAGTGRWVDPKLYSELKPVARVGSPNLVPVPLT